MMTLSSVEQLKFLNLHNVMWVDVHVHVATCIASIQDVYVYMWLSLFSRPNAMHLHTHNYTMLRKWSFFFQKSQV